MLAGPNWLTFFQGTLEYPEAKIGLKIGNIFYKNRNFIFQNRNFLCFKIPRARRAFHPVIIITFKASFMSSSLSLQNLVYTVEAAGRKLLVIHLITGGCSVGFIYFIHFPFYSNPKVISSRVKISMRIFPITS